MSSMKERWAAERRRDGARETNLRYITRGETHGHLPTLIKLGSITPYPYLEADQNPKREAALTLFGRPTRGIPSHPLSMPPLPSCLPPDYQTRHDTYMPIHRSTLVFVPATAFIRISHQRTLTTTPTTIHPRRSDQG